jgi:PAS domain S-box-containing protein
LNEYVELGSAYRSVGEQEYVFITIKNITERKRAEREKEFAQARLNKIVNVARAAYWEMDLESGKLWGSKEWSKMFEYESISEEDFTFSTWHNRIHEEDKHLLTDPMAEYKSGTLFRNNVPFEGLLEFRYRMNNGSYKWVLSLAHYMPVEGKNGIIGGINIDISEMKGLRNELTESRALFENLAQVAPVGIFLNDMEGKNSFVNEKISKWTGLTAEELQGEGWIKCIHPDDRQKVYEGWQGFVNSQAPWKHEYRMIHTDGSYRWVFGNVIQVKRSDGSVLCYIGSITDITQIREKDIKLRDLSNSLMRQYRRLMKYTQINSHELRAPLASILAAVELLRQNQDNYSPKLLAGIQSSANELDNVVRLLNDLLKNVAFEVIPVPYDSPSTTDPVIVIDDDTFQIALTEENLRMYSPDINMKSYTSAQKVLNEIRSGELHPRIILLDLNMPGMDGWQFMEEMEKLQSKVPIHLLTSSVDPSEFNKAKNYKLVRGFLTKPLKAELVETIFF